MSPGTVRRRAVLAAGAAAGLGLGGCAGAPLLSQAPAVSLPGTHRLDLTDPVNGRRWRLQVQRPVGPTPSGGHPVLYLLDGNAAFTLAAQLARNDGARPAPLRPDAAVVVGLGPPDDSPYPTGQRQRDLTPAPGGDSAALLDFIAREVQPRVASAFAVDPRRQTLSGHSFGGLFVLNALFTRPTLFTRYVAASPSIWWADAQVLATAERFIAAQAPGPRAFRAELELLVGGLETAEAAPTAARAATQRERQMLPRAKALAERLQGLGWPELRVRWRVLDGLDHGQVMLPALVQALALAQRAD